MNGAAHYWGHDGWSLTEEQKFELLEAAVLFDKVTSYEGGQGRHSKAVLTALQDVNAWASMGYKQVTLQTV